MWQNWNIFNISFIINQSCPEAIYALALKYSMPLYRQHSAVVSNHIFNSEDELCLQREVSECLQKSKQLWWIFSAGNGCLKVLCHFYHWFPTAWLAYYFGPCEQCYVIHLRGFFARLPLETARFSQQVGTLFWWSNWAYQAHWHNLIKEHLASEMRSCHWGTARKLTVFTHFLLGFNDRKRAFYKHLNGEWWKCLQKVVWLWKIQAFLL